jgi:hypothetical protein
LNKLRVHFEPLSRYILALEMDGDPHTVERSYEGEEEFSQPYVTDLNK